MPRCECTVEGLSHSRKKNEGREEEIKRKEKKRKEKKRKEKKKLFPVWISVSLIFRFARLFRAVGEAMTWEKRAEIGGGGVCAGAGRG